MKVTELRIGNIIKDPVLPLIVDAKLLMAFTTHEDYINLYKPIPLTQKWLTDFGFVKEYNLWHNQIALYKGNPGYPFNYNVCFFEHHNLMTVYHVHQLQNLYFALTGTELLNTK